MADVVADHGGCLNRHDRHYDDVVFFATTLVIDVGTSRSRCHGNDIYFATPVVVDAGTSSEGCGNPDIAMLEMAWELRWVHDESRILDPP